MRRPEIYLFDDSFSALDFKTDARLRAALQEETAEATVMIVGQRVATVMDADRIIVLDEGRIAGMGTHRELYAELRGLQGDRRVAALRGGDRMSDTREQTAAGNGSETALPSGGRAAAASWAEWASGARREAQGLQEDHQRSS